MYYKINIARNGQHYFATAENSCTHQGIAQKVYNDLMEKYPPEQGFRITVAYTVTAGENRTDEFELRRVASGSP